MMSDAESVESVESYHGLTSKKTKTKHKGTVYYGTSELRLTRLLRQGRRLGLDSTHVLDCVRTPVPYILTSIYSHVELVVI